MLYKYKVPNNFIVNGKEFTGKIWDVADNGELIIINGKGNKLPFMFKEIQYVIR